MDKKKSVLNVSVSVIFKLATMVMAILVRRLLIRTCGNDVNGLNSLYVSIIGILAIAELGIGSAITFCMYRPIVEGDNQKISALYHLFRKLYRLIGAVVLVCGLLLTPIIQYLAKDYAQLNVNLHSTFVLMLISVALTYLFGAELSLVNAHKNNYITTAISSGGILLQYVLQIFVLTLTGSFYGYLMCRIISVLVQWLVTRLIARKKYGAIIKDRQQVDAQTRVELVKHIRAMFMHKMGTLLVNTVDSVVIAAFVGVQALGNYTNYTVLQTQMDGLIRLLFTSLISVMGHLYVEKDKRLVQKYCDSLHLLNFMVGTVFYLGYYAVTDSVVAMFFSAELVNPKVISFVIALNGFVQFMRTNTLAFHDATGTFYYDRWKPLVEGVVNLVLSLFLVNRIGMVGTIVATILTNLVICHIVEPYVLYKHALQTTPFKYYIRNYSMIILFFVGLLAVDALLVDMTPGFTAFLLNGFMSVGVSLVLCAGAVVANRKLLRILLDMLKRGKK